MPQRQDIVLRHPSQIPLPAQYAPQQSYGTGMPSEAPEASLLRPILRNWWLVMLFTLIGVGGAIAYIKKSQPLYTSYAKLYIEPTSTAVTDAFGGSERSNFLATQVEVIRSSTILNRVAADATIKDLKTFAPADGKVVWFLREQLNVDLERKTDLIVVSLDSPYPDEAASIVDAIAREYKAYSLESREDQSNTFLGSLKKNADAEDKTVEAKEAEVRAFRIANPNVSLSDQSSAEMQNLTTISQTLTTKQLALIDARAALGADHPKLKGLEQQVKDIQNLYDDAMDKVTRIKGKAVELGRLTAERDYHKDFAAKLAEKYHQLEMTTGGRKLIDIETVEPPRVAEYPSSPRKSRAMLIAAVAGSLLGCGLALLRDKLDGRMRSVEEIQAMIGLPILGVVPAMAGRRTAIARAMTVHLDPRSVVAEAYRTIRTAVYFSTSNARCKTMLLTSPEPGDGKTTCASNLAIAIAQTGRTVLLLDADFRKPTQHKNLDIKDAVGLSSVLAGRETLDTAIQRTGVDGLDILPCGPIPANPSEILNSREFAELVDLLAERYDHIIFDSPPVNRVTDAQILAAVCDATILVLRADKSTRKAGEHARNQLLAVGARVIGAIVNDAPKRKGYDVYGGTYYGSADPAQSIIPSPRRLTAAGIDDHLPPRRDIA